MAKKVLLIDYEPRSVERVRTLLSPPEYSLTVATDGEEGLTLAGGSQFDLVVLSGMLPRLPSAEVIREIRRKGGATAPPILLVVSGYGGSNPKADAQRVGAFDIVVRPFTDQVFLAAVQSALGTDAGARTMRIPTIQMAAAQPTLTSDDIFSDVLEEVGRDRSPLEVTPPRGTPLALTGEQQIEKRLRETLSGMVDRASTRRPPSPPPPLPMPASSAAPASGPRFSTDADIDRMISDTLSGLKVPSRPRPRPRPSPGPDATPEFGVRLETPPPAPSEPFSPAPVPAVVAPPRVSEPHRVSSSGPDQFGQYEILERIAAGGMAELSKARRSGVEGFQKIVAIKKILPHLADNDEFITMFADEAKLAAQLNHPNIVHIFDLGKIEAGGYFIAMEYVDGRDLRSLLQSAREFDTPLPVPLAVYVASKIAAALDYAHRRRDGEGRELNVVHRDVSPPNILISYEGDIKLCDFGIAKAASKASQTQSGALKGKVQYMSPEQAWGRPIDRRSDIFSLGCVLFEMLTGEKLFRGDTDLSVLEKVRAAQVLVPSTVNPEVPRGLDAIVAKALAREPEERYGIASDMLRDLEGVLYSYTPAPGSADLAIYLHRLQAEESARQETKDREASRGGPAPEPAPPRKSKGAPVARRTGSTPRLVVPPDTLGTRDLPPAAKKEPTDSGVFGSFSATKTEAERKSRMPLYAMIAASALLLTGLAVWLTRRAPAVAPARALPTAVPAAAPTAAPPAAAVTPVAGVDPKAIEDEVQRQIASRRKELQKALESSKPSRVTPPAAAVKRAEEPAVAPPLVTVREAAPEPARPEPTVREIVPEPTSVPAPPTRPPPARAEPRDEVTRGDLVGPGAGVVEPALLSTPRVTYPPIARQQRLTGKVIVLALVTEDGVVSEARVQQGLPSRTGVNEAVLEAVRASKFRPATKGGVPVRMWRTVVVDVRP